VRVRLAGSGVRAGQIAAGRVPMSYYRFAEMVVALCFGLTFALVCWWGVAGPIWREEFSGSAEEWLEVTSATLLACATLIGGAGALYVLLRRV
jgi:hypothetical protein